MKLSALPWPATARRFPVRISSLRLLCANRMPRLLWRALAPGERRRAQNSIPARLRFRSAYQCAPSDPECARCVSGSAMSLCEGSEARRISARKSLKRRTRIFARHLAAKFLLALNLDRNPILIAHLAQRTPRFPPHSQQKQTPASPTSPTRKPSVLKLSSSRFSSPYSNFHQISIVSLKRMKTT